MRLQREGARIVQRAQAPVLMDDGMCVAWDGVLAGVCVFRWRELCRQ